MDPDKIDESNLKHILGVYESLGVDYIFVGGSLLTTAVFDETISKIKGACSLPVILFPGSVMQISQKADAILFLSLISGRNAELLIGQHVLSAPSIKKSQLEVLPTGYMLVDGGNMTTANYISQTAPIPHNKPEIASTTAMAGEMLGLKLMYLDGGSGAASPVSPAMINAVKKHTDTPLIVGGGIRSKEALDHAFQAGADIVVIGNSLEDNPSLIDQLFESEYLQRKVKA